MKIKKELSAKNKEIRKRNVKRAVSLLFYTSTLVTSLCIFMTIISQGQPSAGDIESVTKLLMILAIIGCVSFGKIVLVATKRHV